MFRVGVHESGGVQAALESAAKRPHANAFQAFAKAKLSYYHDRNFRKTYQDIAETLPYVNLDLVIHSSYIINLISQKQDIAKLSLASLITELDSANFLGAKYLVMHPGTRHKLQDRTQAINKLKDALRFVTLDNNWDTKLLLETMPGGKDDTQIGSLLDELADIVNTLKEEGANIGTCFDTCHVHAAGYDFSSTPNKFDLFWHTWTDYFTDPPSVLHINGAANTFASKKDGHATLDGHRSPTDRYIQTPSINPEMFDWLRNSTYLANSIHILETPIQHHDKDLESYTKSTKPWTPTQ